MFGNFENVFEFQKMFMKLKCLEFSKNVLKNNNVHEFQKMFMKQKSVCEFRKYVWI